MNKTKIDKKEKVADLKEKLRGLKEEKLPQALLKYGQAYQNGSGWHENAVFEIADEEVAVLRVMILDLKKEIRGLRSEK